MKKFLLFFLLFIACNKGSTQRYVSTEAYFYPSIFKDDNIHKEGPYTIDIGKRSMVIRCDSGIVYMDLVKDSVIRKNGIRTEVYIGYIEKEAISVNLIYSASNKLLRVSMLIRWSRVLFIINHETSYLKHEVHGKIL